MIVNDVLVQQDSQPSLIGFFCFFNSVLNFIQGGIKKVFKSLKFDFLKPADTLGYPSKHNINRKITTLMDSVVIRVSTRKNCYQTFR